MKKHLTAALFAVLLLIPAVAFFMIPRSVAQNAGQTLGYLLPADLIQVYRAGTAAITYAKPSQITAQSGFYTSVPPTGLFTITLADNVTVVAFEPASTVTTGYVTMPAHPGDGQQVCIYSKSAVTNFYPTANSGQTLNDAATSLSALAHVCYVYGQTSTAWNRSQ